MLNELQIETIVSRLKVALKAAARHGGDNIPEYTPVYKLAIEHAEEIAVHASKAMPDKLLTQSANETTEEFNQRVKLYQAKTKKYWDKALGRTNRYWNNQNWQVKYGEDAAVFSGSSLQDYLERDFPVYRNVFERFFKGIKHNKTMADPNAVVAVKPHVIPTKEIVGEDGETIFIRDDTKLIEPVPFIYGSRRAVMFKEGWYFVGMSNEKSKLQEDTGENNGLIFELYDDELIYTITQVGVKSDYKFEVDEYFAHNYGALPCWKLGGFEVEGGEDNNEWTLYESFFSAAIPDLNEAVGYYSDLSFSTKKLNYPIPAYYTDDCGDCDGKGLSEFDNKVSKCKSCNGSGKSVTLTRGQDYTIPLPKFGTDAETTALPFPPIAFIAPPTDNLRFTKELADELASKAFLALNIDTAEKPSGVSATEKAIDLDELKDFLIKIKSIDTEVDKNVVHAINWMRYAEKKTDPVMSWNDDFQIRTATDLSEEYNGLREAKAPGFVLDIIESSYTKQRFHNDDFNERVLKVLQAVDILHHKDDVTVTAMLSAQRVTRETVMLHDNIEKYLKELIKENEGNKEWIFDTPIAEIEAKMREMAADDTPALESAQSDRDILGSL